MDGEAVKQAVITAFEYSYAHDDWVNPLEEALRGVTAEDALWKPTPDSKNIWEIVLHLAVWNENIVARMQSGEKAHPSEGAWPALPAVPDEAAWETAQKRLLASLTGVRAWMEASPPEALLGGPYGLADLLCRATHNAYHIGQITKMREVQTFLNATEQGS